MEGAPRLRQVPTLTAKGYTVTAARHLSQPHLQPSAPNTLALRKCRAFVAGAKVMPI